MFLAIDSSLATSVAVVSGEGDILAELSSTDARGHAENIGALIQDTLAKAGLEPAAITHVVMGVGPGPFTGLRVGMAAAQAFALSRNLPVVPVISHDAIAHGAGDVVTVTDARRGEVAYSVYVGDAVRRRILGPALTKPEDLDSTLAQYATLPRREVSSISAGALGQVAQKYVAASIELDPSAPQYLRAPDVTVAS